MAKLRANCYSIEFYGKYIIDRAAQITEKIKNVQANLDYLNQGWTGKGATEHTKSANSLISDLNKMVYTTKLYGDKLIEIATEFEKFENDEANEMEAI